MSNIRRPTTTRISNSSASESMTSIKKRAKAAAAAAATTEAEAGPFSIGHQQKDAFEQMAKLAASEEIGGIKTFDPESGKVIWKFHPDLYASFMRCCVSAVAAYLTNVSHFRNTGDSEQTIQEKAVRAFYALKVEMPDIATSKEISDYWGPPRTKSALVSAGQVLKDLKDTEKEVSLDIPSNEKGKGKAQYNKEK